MHEIVAPAQEQVEPLIKLGAFGVVGMMMLAGLVLVIYLIANPKTRSFGLILGFLGLFLTGSVFIALFTYRMSAYVDRPAEVAWTSHPPLSDVNAAYDTLTKPRIELSQEPAPPPAVTDMPKPQAPPPAGNILIASTTAPNETREEATAVLSKPDDEAVAETIPKQSRANEKVPDWVTNPPKRIGNVDRRVVSVGPYKSFEECDQNLDGALYRATSQYMQQILGAPYQLDEQQLARMGIHSGFVRREICRDHHVKDVEASFGPMKELYVLMEFSPTVDRDLKNAWYAYRREDNLFGVALFSGSILGILGLVFGLLQVDTWTKGYYTKRLFLGVPLAIIGFLTLLAMLGV